MSGEYTKVSNNHFWEDVTNLLEGFSGIGKHRESLQGFLKLHRVEGPYVLIGTHSPGRRDWSLTLAGVSAPFFGDPEFPEKGWYVFSEEDVTRIALINTGTGAKLEARRQANRLWSIELTVPIKENGEPDEGGYWDAFHALISMRYRVSSPT